MSRTNPNFGKKLGHKALSHSWVLTTKSTAYLHSPFGISKEYKRLEKSTKYAS